MLEQQRVAAPRRIEDAEMEGPFEDEQQQRNRENRRTQKRIMLVA